MQAGPRNERGEFWARSNTRAACDRPARFRQRRNGRRKPHEGRSFFVTFLSVRKQEPFPYSGKPKLSALMKSGPPAKPGACVSPERASYRQASQEALKKSAACITCPAARKRAPFVQDYLSGNRKVVHLFPLRSMLEAKAFLLSPADLRVVISLKHTRQKPQQPYGLPRFYFSSLISPCFSSKRSIESRI